MTDLSKERAVKVTDVETHARPGFTEIIIRVRCNSPGYSGVPGDPPPSETIPEQVRTHLKDWL